MEKPHLLFPVIVDALARGLYVAVILTAVMDEI